MPYVVDKKQVKSIGFVSHSSPFLWPPPSAFSTATRISRCRLGQSDVWPGLAPAKAHPRTGRTSMQQKRERNLRFDGHRNAPIVLLPRSPRLGLSCGPRRPAGPSGWYDEAQKRRRLIRNDVPALLVHFPSSGLRSPYASQAHLNTV